MRLEQTNTKGHQLVTYQQSDTSYLQLFPSLVLDYTLSAHHEFSVTLNKRIDRPTYKQLNPFKFYIDPTTYISGNPYLRPQETFNAEADYIFNKTLTIKLAYSQTHDNITEVLYPSESSSLITVQTDKNLKSVKYYSADISYAADIAKRWNTTSEFILYKGIYEGDVANTVLHNGNLTYNINSNNTYSFAKKYNAELDFEYRAGEVYGYYYIKPIWQLTAGLQTNVLKKKGTIKLNYSDIFSTYVVRGSTSFRDYYESFHTRKELSVCTFSFTYRFGKSSVPSANKRISGAEDEKNRANTGNQ